MNPVSNILVVGKPKSGKTTFFAQFYLRVQRRKSAVTLWKAPKNIKVIEDAINRLSSGEEPQSTPADSNEELVLPVQIDAHQMELVCPDYGGEQINGMVDLMEYNENWRQRVTDSDNWILFIRPGAVVNYYDLTNAGHEKLEKKRSEGPLQSPLSEQCQQVELLQALLYIKGTGVKRRITKPSLLIVLTCWDELNEPQSPPEYLHHALPLLHDFVLSNWEPTSFKVCGLSAQEFALHDQASKERFQNEMPENFGFFVSEDGTHTKDITQLLKDAIQ